jgi:hypothetical protein
MKEASRQVDLEEAVRWERDRRGLPKDGIDDWKRRSIIYAYLTMIVMAAVVYLGVMLNYLQSAILVRYKMNTDEIISYLKSLVKVGLAGAATALIVFIINRV